MNVASIDLRFRHFRRIVVLACTVFVASWNLCLGQSQQDPRANSAESMRQQLYKISAAITAPENVGRDIERDIALLGQLPAIRQCCEDAEKEFAKEIATDVQPYRNLVGTIRYSREQLSKFEDAIRSYASLARMREDAEAMLQSANRSIENQAPAYFKPGNDIDLRSKSLKMRLKVLEILMPDSKELTEGGELAKLAFDDTRKLQKKLLAGILEQNELPSDNYSKADRKSLLKLVEETWLKGSPKDRPIRVGLIGSDWVRTEAWEFQNRTAYKIDRSRMQGFVVLPHDGTTVVVRHIQLQRDHTNQDKTAAWSVSDPKAAAEPMELVLKSKLK